MSDEPATPRQVAYLRYMGYAASPDMGKEKASQVIDNLYEIMGGEEIGYSFTEKQGQWRRDKFILHRDLYNEYELKEFLQTELSEVLHDYVRKRIVGASERLTKAKIRGVIESLTEVNREWWRADNYQQTFFEDLKSKRPACCDGRPPDKAPKPSGRIQAGSSSPSVARKDEMAATGKSSGMSISTILILLVVAVLVIMKIFGSR